MAGCGGGTIPLALYFDIRGDILLLFLIIALGLHPSFSTMLTRPLMSGGVLSTLQTILPSIFLSFCREIIYLQLVNRTIYDVAKKSQPPLSPSSLKQHAPFLQPPPMHVTYEMGRLAALLASSYPNSARVFSNNIRTTTDHVYHGFDADLSVHGSMVSVTFITTSLRNRDGDRSTPSGVARLFGMTPIFEERGAQKVYKGE